MTLPAALAFWRDREAVMSLSKLADARKVNVLLIGESSRLFSLCRFPLEKAGCECHFAESNREVSILLTQTKLDIVLTIYTHQRHSEMMALLAGLRVSMFYVLPVEGGCWWLPALRNGENCLGAPAIRASEFTYVLIEIMKSIITDTASSEPSVV
jgi:hypothetical protein